jgi:hypothetical protein
MILPPLAARGSFPEHRLIDFSKQNQLNGVLENIICWLAPPKSIKTFFRYRRQRKTFHTAPKKIFLAAPAAKGLGRQLPNCYAFTRLKKSVFGKASLRSRRGAFFLGVFEFGTVFSSH